jgi:DNA-binding NtrC family response regulator
MLSVELGAACRQCVSREVQCPVGQCPSMSRLRSLVEELGHKTCTILIQGESGTGKELVARHMHASGPRRHKPFVPVDCTVLRDTLFESQLFGHLKGSFTGAEHSTLGFFRAADGGTLFLDEIGEMNLHVQAKLLRCIQDRAVVPLGGVDPIPVDVRIIAATHRDLKAMVSRGEFRQDLYFRLNVVRVCVPPLRERGPDILILARHFLEQCARMDGAPTKYLSPDAIVALQSYDWPGNVREIANVMEQAHVLSRSGFVSASDLPEEITSRQAGTVPGIEAGIVPLAAAELDLITRALRVTAGNQSRAAQMLQIDRRRLYRKVRQYGLASLVR